jgi:hypothetical protein
MAPAIEPAAFDPKKPVRSKGRRHHLPSATRPAAPTPSAPPFRPATSPEPLVETPAPAVHETVAPAPAVVPRPDGGHVTSGRPRDSIPPPRLQSVYQAHGREDLAAMCQLVEGETVSRAGVTPAFASGVTTALRQALENGDSVEIYPAAMYYFIISEAARGHDKEAAGRALLASHKSRALRRLDSMVSDERKR